MEAACIFCILWEVTGSLARGCAHGVYIYALHSLLKAGTLFALEEHSPVNIVLNFFSPGMITELFLY